MGSLGVTQPYERVTATFRPRRVDDLVEGAAAYIGQSGIFEAYWLIEDGEAYAGEWAMKIPADWDFGGPIWVPECDLDPAS